MTARRLELGDLAFVQTLMARPELSAHKPVPTRACPQDIAEAHTKDITHWRHHGFGRYLVRADQPIGLCGITRRGDMPGLNLSYHLLPEHWGKGHATTLVRALVGLVEAHLPDAGPLFGLVRPANPASARVLQKAGFTRDRDLILGGVPTTRYIRI